MPSISRKTAVALVALAGLCATAPAALTGPTPDWAKSREGNPLIPGYFADPSIIRHDGTWYIYATVDPWGGGELGVWSSNNFADWTFHRINWPNKAAATSPTSNQNRVWAPSVVKGRDGRFWMYVSIGSEVWVGVADTPLGPWRNALGNRPLIPGNFRPGFHMIDAEAFMDDDGHAYLYWGSGIDWVNGHCFVVRLNSDMTTFDGEPRDVTPANYFEAPFMVKRGERYYLMYSNGKTTEDSYEVRYAVGASPMGPFTEGRNSPILSTDRQRQIISPGHHAIFNVGGRDYILYHRQALPFTLGGTGDLLRQISVDTIQFGADGPAKVQPTHRGNHPGAERIDGTVPVRAWTASSSIDPLHGPSQAADSNYATLWRAAAGADGWLQADLGVVHRFHGVTIRPEFPERRHRYRLLLSLDGRDWREAVPDTLRDGSPVTFAGDFKARYVRLVTDASNGIFEWSLDR